MAHKRRSPGLRPHGDGTRGPHHSSTCTPAGRVSVAIQPASGPMACGLFASAGIQSAPHVGWFLLLILSTAATSAVTITKRMLRKPLKTTVAVFLCIFIVFLLSGFNLEGNMDRDATDDNQWLLAAEAETRAIEEMPFVKEVSFNYGETANECKVFATLWCCWDSGRKSLKKVPMNCTLDGERPTHLEALRVLREKLAREHGAPDHTHHPKAVASRQRHEAQGSVQGSAQQPEPDKNVFDRMKAAASRLHVAQQRAAADAAALEQAAAAELAAVQLPTSSCRCARVSCCSVTSHAGAPHACGHLRQARARWTRTMAAPSARRRG